MSKRNRTSIACDPNTLETVRSLKRCGETYDNLLRKMANQYDPEQSSD